MSMLIRNRQIVENDFRLLADDEPPPAEGKVIVSLARWQQDRELQASPLVIGVRLPNTADVTQIWAEIADRPLINLEFPGFGDGRAYSQARLLRDRYRYTGEIRASGAAVVRDQMHNMHRCGIDSFELRADQDPQVCLAAFADFREAYQPAADTVVIVARKRLAVTG